MSRIALCHGSTTTKRLLRWPLRFLKSRLAFGLVDNSRGAPLQLLVWPPVGLEQAALATRRAPKFWPTYPKNGKSSRGRRYGARLFLLLAATAAAARPRGVGGHLRCARRSNAAYVINATLWQSSLARACGSGAEPNFARGPGILWDQRPRRVEPNDFR